MKKATLLVLVLFLGTHLMSQGESNPSNITYPYKNVLKLSPVELVRAEFQVGYERYFKNRAQSLNVLTSIISGKNGSETRDGLQLFGQYRFFLSHLQKETHQTLNMYNIGFYTAPYALGLTYKGTYESGDYDPINGEFVTKLIDERINAFEAGALMGIQLDITSRIVLDLFLGGGVRRSFTDVSDESQNEYGLMELGYTGVKPRIGLQMGITF